MVPRRCRFASFCGQFTKSTAILFEFAFHLGDKWSSTAMFVRCLFRCSRTLHACRIDRGIHFIFSNWQQFYAIANMLDGKLFIRCRRWETSAKSDTMPSCRLLKNEKKSKKLHRRNKDDSIAMNGINGRHKWIAFYNVIVFTSQMSVYLE